ncbi:MAG: hypothetical protein U0401_17930 [Anaerolineae bacterium]
MQNNTPRRSTQMPQPATNTRQNTDKNTAGCLTGFFVVVIIIVLLTGGTITAITIGRVGRYSAITNVEWEYPTPTPRPTPTPWPTPTPEPPTPTPPCLLCGLEIDPKLLILPTPTPTPYESLISKLTCDPFPGDFTIPSNLWIDHVENSFGTVIYDLDGYKLYYDGISKVQVYSPYSGLSYEYSFELLQQGQWTRFSDFPFEVCVDFIGARGYFINN